MKSVEVIYCDDLPWDFAEKIERPVGFEFECESKQFKGYSGCICEGCSRFKALKSPWVVGVHGAVTQDDSDDEECDTAEIFVARRNNLHAFASYGWDNPNINDPDAKIMILDDCVSDKQSWNMLIRAAKKMASDLNKRDCETT